MNIRFVVLLACAFQLAACSSMRSLVSFEDASEPAPAPAIAAPAAAPAPSETDAWCQRGAASERARAQVSGFDAATLDRMTVQAYQQCRTLGAK